MEIKIIIIIIIINVGIHSSMLCNQDLFMLLTVEITHDWSHDYSHDFQIFDIVNKLFAYI